MKGQQHGGAKKQVNLKIEQGRFHASKLCYANRLCYWPIGWQFSVMSEGEGGVVVLFCFFNQQLCLDTGWRKFSHFSTSNSFPSSSKQVSPTGMSWFLCGQIEMSELALEQKRWRRSKRSGKANELSHCCHTQTQTGWRVSTGVAPQSPLHLNKPRKDIHFIFNYWPFLSRPFWRCPQCKCRWVGI